LLALVAILAWAVWQGRTGDVLWGGVVTFSQWEFHPLAVLFAVSGSLMISTIRIPKP
jgi:CDP-diacylglycerol--serine O-phosphatidyltransferase